MHSLAPDFVPRIGPPFSPPPKPEPQEERQKEIPEDSEESGPIPAATRKVLLFAEEQESCAGPSKVGARAGRSHSPLGTSWRIKRGAGRFEDLLLGLRGLRPSHNDFSNMRALSFRKVLLREEKGSGLEYSEGLV